MSVPKFGLLALLCSGVAFAQGGAAATLSTQTTLPIVFTKTIDAGHAKAGDPVVARTLQRVQLSDGREVKAGSQVLGHVVSAEGFVFDKTPYAKQRQSTLAVQVDSLTTAQGEKIPLHVYLRAMADTFATSAASEPRTSDEDTLLSTTQVGGDILTPSQNEIINIEGDVVGYNKRGGNYAHLIVNTGAGAARCDGSNSEQAVAHFSASACGLYGFQGISLTSTGLGSNSSTFTLTSARRSSAIFAHSTALLEVLPTADVASILR